MASGFPQPQAPAPKNTMLIKAGDNVVVISGGDSIKEEDGSRPTHPVIQVDRAKGKALVEGVNLVWKHVRRSQKYPQGGRLRKEMPVDVSNIMYFCSSCNQPARLGARFLDDGSKERYCKKCDASAGRIAPPRASHTKS